MPRHSVGSPHYTVPVTRFSQSVRVPAGSDLIVVSGITARDESGAVVGRGDAEAQARQIFRNIALVLAASDATLDDVVRMTTYLTDMADQPKVAAARLDAFAGPLPASTTVQVVRLFDPEMLLEIEVLAAVPPAAGPRPT
jgi:enamine deaminase RidA (YjgF/YER057c/UK114 family)